MRVSSTEEYGLRCIIRVARGFATDRPVTAIEVSQQEAISVPYAQKLLRRLAGAGLLVSRRGVGGGYLLAADPAHISLLDVVRALDGELQATDVCQRYAGTEEDQTCQRMGACSIQPVWSHIEKVVARSLERVSLQSLVEGQDAVRRELRDAPSDDALYCPVEQLKVRT